MPPADVAKYVAKLSKEISEKEKAYFILDNKNFYPHITIYTSEYPNCNIKKILDKVEKISKKLSGVKFKFKKIDDDYGYVGVVMHRSKEIRKIHEIIISELNPLREGHIREKFHNSDLSKEEKENIQKYGYPNLINLYSPHITITRLKNEKNAREISKEIKWFKKEFILGKIGVYGMGENGTCTELIKEFKLR
ncbi:MAG: hypothetical protein US30_C0017G0001 [Candidatus Moranbacteria bacterium GW2011_GWF2_36_839]|nr:MAG: hypothetical protein US27_C0018G0001 [Candidatus Moranbacteria bacterium GW2011_GWF1_36_78]KKQ16457.1 MAG: hypothetical protein US30_C0017G0001 [Candidatus Moranbacteria bacterium GW2011_GWF2_36_839]